MNRAAAEWCDYIWNPVTGCGYRCRGCKARATAMRFCGNINQNLFQNQEEADKFILEEPFAGTGGRSIPYPYGFRPTLHQYRFGENSVPCQRKEGCRILIGAMGDLFAPWIPDQWIEQVFAECQNHPQHLYQFITKTPGRYEALLKAEKLPEEDNFWYGIHADSPELFEQIKSLELPDYTWMYLDMQSDLDGRLEVIQDQISWLIAGGDPGRRLQREKKVDQLAEWSGQSGIPVFAEAPLLDQINKQQNMQNYPIVYTEYKEQQAANTRYYTECMECRTKNKKSNMQQLLVRAGTKQTPKNMGYLCGHCFDKIHNNWKGME